MLITRAITRSASASAFDAHRRRCRAAVLCRHADGPYASAASCFTAAERHLYRHSGRYRHALLPGSDAGQAGAATTLYTITTRVGWIIAGSLAGVVAEIWNYHTVFWIALVMCVLTLSCLTRIKDV